MKVRVAGSMLGLFAGAVGWCEGQVPVNHAEDMLRGLGPGLSLTSHPWGFMSLVSLVCLVVGFALGRWWETYH
jgi:hypothetical protein